MRLRLGVRPINLKQRVDEFESNNPRRALAMDSNLPTSILPSL
jgi:hypothetical protein